MGSGDERIAWHALVHVRRMPGQTCELNGNVGAFASVLALAHDEAEYREVVAAEMQSLGLFIAEIEDFAPYLPDQGDSQNVKLCAAQLSPEWPVQYGDFYSYPQDQA